MPIATCHSIKRMLCLTLILIPIFPGLLAANELYPGVDSYWLRAASGATHLIPDQRGTSKNGYHLQLAGLLESSWQAWNLSLGAGAFYNRLYSDGEKSFANEQTQVRQQQIKLRIETRAALAELSVRYSGLLDDWQMGLTIRQLFGSSLNFGQDIGKDASYGRIFIGPQLLRRIAPLGSWQQALDLSLLTDLDVPRSRIYLFSLAYALGTSSQPQKHELPEPPKASPVLPVFEALFADKIIHFPSASASLEGATLAFVQELAYFLKARADIWQALEIQGHTDKKGSVEYNVTLSQKRADAVMRVMLQSGLQPSQLRAKGYGPHRPVLEGDSPEILAQNRRVHMVFELADASGRDALSMEIARLKQKYFKE